MTTIPLLLPYRYDWGEGRLSFAMKVSSSWASAALQSALYNHPVWSEIEGAYNGGLIFRATYEPETKRFLVRCSKYNPRTSCRVTVDARALYHLTDETLDRAARTVALLLRLKR